MHLALWYNLRFHEHTVNGWTVAIPSGDSAIITLTETQVKASYIVGVRARAYVHLCVRSRLCKH